MDLASQIFPHQLENKMKEILHFSGKKSFLMLLIKSLENASFSKRGRRCHPQPPIPPFWDIMTQEIQISY